MISEELKRISIPISHCIKNINRHIETKGLNHSTTQKVIKNLEGIEMVLYALNIDYDYEYDENNYITKAILDNEIIYEKEEN